MKIEQICTGCMSHAAYYLENNSEVAIFDPLREVQSYIDRANADNAKIKYVFETHFHADFVSGHLDLAKHTGAEIVYGPTAKPSFNAIVAKDNQLFKVGNYTVKAIHARGNTKESTKYMLIDENGKEHALITGDKLFIGDFGRLDLAQQVIADLTEQKLAADLYESLRNKTMPLKDGLIIYPNHGAVGANGGNMHKETSDTFGNHQNTNQALRPDMTDQELIKEVLNGLTNTPVYLPKNDLINVPEQESLDTVLEGENNALSIGEFEMLANETFAIIIDSRSPEIFAQGFIPNSINIGLDSNFAVWVSEVITGIKQEILIVAEPGRENETVIRLARVGYEHSIGFLDSGIESWKKAGKKLETIQRISAETLEQEYASRPVIIDVRKRSEFDSEHLQGAINIPLNEISKHLSEIPKDKPFILYCKGGYRSMIAASILKARGWDNFVDVIGGMSAIKKTSLPFTEYVFPSPLL